MLGVMAGFGPEQSHETWLAEKLLAGWRFGVAKDAARKEHPCFVPWAELPPEQKAKDDAFVAVVRAVAAALGRPAAPFIWSPAT